MLIGRKKFSLLSKESVLAVAFLLVSNISFSQTPAAPTVVSPVNLCLGSPASPLTAQGSNLQWIMPVTSTVGGSAMFGNDATYVSNSGGNNKRTNFTTTVANVKITSVDYTIKGYSGGINNLKLGIFNASGTLLASSSTSTSSNPSSSVKISNTFNYTITEPGQYSIGIASGSGNIGYDNSNPTFPIAEWTAAVQITGVSNQYLCFNNIKFSTEIASNSAPTPSTEVGGNFNYYVTQTVNGKKSPKATIVVKVNTTPPPTVVNNQIICQGSSTPLSATGSNLKWVSSTVSSVGGSSFFTNGTHIASGSSNNKKTHFETLEPNTTLASVDYTIPAYQSANLQLGLFNSNNILIATSDLKSTNAGASPVKVTSIFNYTITSPGQYSIGIYEGSGQIGYENASFPITEPTQLMNIIGASDGKIRAFNNFKFSVPGKEYSETAPVPASINAGTSTYYVTQTVNGCESAPAIITVHISGIVSTAPGMTCAGQKAVLGAVASEGYTLRWYANATTNTVLATGSEYTTPTLNTTTTYYVAASKGSCVTPRLPVQAIIGGFTWKQVWGSTAWSNKSNWISCTDNYPPDGADVRIPQTVNIVTLDRNVVINNLVFQGSSIIDLNGYTLTVSSITGEGSIRGSNTSNLIMKGTANSVINFDPLNFGTSNVLKNLTIDNNSRTITLGNSLIVNGIINISGSSTLISNGNLTLKATDTSNANVGSLSNGGSIVGNVLVQNYYKGGDAAFRGFRTITSPVHDIKTPAKGYKLAGYKSTMYVTGAGGAANGFDDSPNNGATIKYYNEPKKANQNQYLVPANTSETLTQGKGIYFYFRGKKNASPGYKFVKNSAGKYDTPENVLMEYWGEINTGNISPVLSYTNHAGEASSNGFNLIGNPYPAVIDWNKVTKTNLNNTIWVQRQNGTFAIFDGTVSSNGGSQFILPGQGFFVKANSTNATVTFTENSKAVTNAPAVRLLNTNESSLLTFEGEQTQGVKPNSFSKMGITLFKDEFSTDETVLVFRSSNSNLYDNDDIAYQGEGAVSLTSVTADKKYLAINYMADITSSTEVNLYAGFNETGTYSLSLSDLTAMENVVITLKDNYLKKMIDLRAVKSYSFDVDKAQASSFGENRFSIVFQPPVQLPVNLLNFSAKKADQGGQLKWITETEKTSSYFDVEQSADGKSFYAIGRIAAAGTAAAQTKYDFLDKNPAAGMNYYRLKHVDIQGNFSYSEIISLDYALKSIAPSVTVYPNPAANEIRVNINGSSDVVTQLNVYNIEGKKILSSNQAYMDITSLNKGMYIVETITSDKSILLEKCKIIKN